MGFRSEFEVGDFYRVFALNESIDAEKIVAELKHRAFAQVGSRQAA
jgi:HSP20 family molecular chaperone IbpA